MRRIFVLLFLFFLVTSPLSSVATDASGTEGSLKIGYVNVNTVLENDTRYRRNLETWRTYRRRLLQQVQKQISDLKNKSSTVFEADARDPSEKNQRVEVRGRFGTLNVRHERAQRLANRKRSSLRSRVMERLTRAAREVRETRDLLLVVTRNSSETGESFDGGILAAKDAVDVTRAVLETMQE